MKLLVVIPFCGEDQEKAEKLVKWIGELGGCKDNDLLLVSGLDAGIVPELSRSEHFKSVSLVDPPFKLNDESHPRGPNLMFETACKWVTARTKTPFLWLEPDAVPMRKGWLEMIEAEYETALKYKKKILAHVTHWPNLTPKSTPSGVAVYPHDAWNIYSKLSLNRNQAWDIQFADKVMPIVHQSRSIANLVNRKTPPSFGPNGLKVEGIPSYVALWHQCKDDTLIAALRERAKAKPKTRLFYHSGDFGDIIYSLPVIEAMGGGELLLGPDNRGFPAREAITPQRYEVIAPLLRQQKYIGSVSYSDSMPDDATDLNQGRAQILKDRQEKNGANICQSVLKRFKIPESHAETKWLTVTPKHVAQVVIARSPRYHDETFDWKLILKKHPGAAFIGLPSEHQVFEHEFGKIDYYPTKDLLEAAEIIAGCRLFIGNQSSPYAIAEALKKPAILEVCPETPNCYFHREGVTHGMPKFEEPEPVKTERKFPKVTRGELLVIRGPVDMFSGFAHIIRQIVEGMNKRGHNTKIAPTMISKGPQPDVPEISAEVRGMMVSHKTPAPVIISMHCGLPHIITGGEVVMTMWESTRISPETCKALNKASRLIVPTEWAATSFNACGVNVPISIVPLGVDTNIYKPKPFSKGKLFLFGCAGRIALGGMRKGIDDVIQAFQKAFPPDDQIVRLEVKVFSDCKFTLPPDPRIRVNTRFLPNLADWYTGLNCFVSASRGEGWGLQPHQAMAVGRPLIAPRFGGHSEYFDDSVGWPVKYELVNASGYYEGKGVWAETDINDLAMKMHYAVEHRSECMDKGRNAAIRAAKFSVENMVDHFEDALKKSNVI